MATIQQITVELTEMAIIYQRPLSPQELQVLVTAWTGLCFDLTDAEFVAACKAYSRKSRYFPTPADILDAHKSAENPYQGHTLALPEQAYTVEDFRMSEISSAMCLLALRDPAAKRFFELEDWQDKDEFARKMLGDEYPKPQAKRYPRQKGPVHVADAFGGLAQ